MVLSPYSGSPATDLVIDFGPPKKQFCLKEIGMKKNSFREASLASVTAEMPTPSGVKTARPRPFLTALPATNTTTDPDENRVQRIVLATGVALEYVEQGDKNGLPVILLHGITDSWRSFESTLPYLPSSFHVFAISQRGHGNSDKPQRRYTPRHFAHDIAAFIQKKQLEAAVIVGHSMGGVVAQQFALLYPQLVKALVIVASDPALHKNPGMPAFCEEVQNMTTPLSRAYLETFQLATLSTPIDGLYFQRLVDESMKVPQAIFAAALKGLMDVDLSEQLPQIECPTLVFWGTHDAFCRKEGQDLLRKGLPGAQWRIYEGAGHALHWERPGQFATDLTEFLQSLALLFFRKESNPVY